VLLFVTRHSAECPCRERYQFCNFLPSPSDPLCLTSLLQPATPLLQLPYRHLVILETCTALAASGTTSTAAVPSPGHLRELHRSCSERHYFSTCRTVTSSSWRLAPLLQRAALPPQLPYRHPVILETCTALAANGITSASLPSPGHLGDLHRSCSEPHYFRSCRTVTWSS
jgi:hypothetical protein